MNKPNFAAMKGSAAALSEKLQGKLKEDNSSGRQDDERFWRQTPDKNGNAYAVIRFLPPAPNPAAPNGMEDAFYVKIFTHFFKGKTGQVYAENSLTTIGEDDPVGLYNSELWATGVEALKNQARAQKRKTVFISNILVVDDPAKPENNGKVFLYKYGKKIFDMINDKMHPEFPGEKKINPFDFWEGANFKLKVRKVDDFPNYDKSEFDAPSPVAGGDDEKIEAIWNKQYPLLPLIARDQFKPFDVLKAKLDRVLGTGPAVRGTSSSFVEEAGEDTNTDEVVEDDAPRSGPSGMGPPSDEDEINFFRSVGAKG